MYINQMCLVGLKDILLWFKDKSILLEIEKSIQIVMLEVRRGLFLRTVKDNVEKSIIKTKIKAFYRWW